MQPVDCVLGSVLMSKGEVEQTKCYFSCLINVSAKYKNMQLNCRDNVLLK